MAYYSQSQRFQPPGFNPRNERPSGGGKQRSGVRHPSQQRSRPRFYQSEDPCDAMFAGAPQTAEMQSVRHFLKEMHDVGADPQRLVEAVRWVAAQMQETRVDPNAVPFPYG